jgi:hypothetical protein
MAKTIITNLDSLIDVKVTENVNVVTANAASANATVKAGEAATSADVAELHKIAAADSVVAAGVAADNAVASADAASVSAGVSTTQAGIATVQAGLAVTAKNDTDALYAAALDVLTQTNKIYDDFDDRWLGGHSSNPTVDNDGNDVLDGALYWNTTVKAIRVYSQTSEAWADIKDANGSLLIVNNLADVNDNAEARTNIDVYSKAETTAEAVAQIELQKGAANGIAELDINGLVPSTQLPSYVDDVVEVATKAGLPAIGESGKIYVVVADETSNGDTSSYRWTGTVYAMVSNTLTATDIKALYESNLDTNAFTDAERTKLANQSGVNTGDQDLSGKADVATTLAGYGITDAYTKTELNAVNVLRADKYLAAQNIANMIYTTGNLTKIQYNTATDVNYEVLTYGVDGLSNVAHYINSVLIGNTVLTYATGDLVSAVYTGV